MESVEDASKSFDVAYRVRWGFGNPVIAVDRSGSPTDADRPSSHRVSAVPADDTAKMVEAGPAGTDLVGGPIVFDTTARSISTARENQVNEASPSMRGFARCTTYRYGRGMHEEPLVPPADVIALVHAHIPGYQVGSVTFLGEGQDNISYEVDHELIVRFGKDPDRGRRSESVRRESRLLTVVARLSPVPVPRPLFVAAEHGCLAYRRLAGQPLIGLSAAIRAGHADSVAAVLGELLSVLHTTDREQIADLVDEDVLPPRLWLDEAVDNYTAVVDHVPEQHRPAVESFLATPPPSEGAGPVFSHNDLGVEHILLDPRTHRVSGIIDWSDAAMVDAAYDFGLICRDLGPTALDAALDSYRTRFAADPAIGDRALFYARCSVFEDLAYGLHPEHRMYFDKSVTALTWLFPPQKR